VSGSLALALSLDSGRQSRRWAAGVQVARQKEGNMLRIYLVVLEVLKQLVNRE
jgi:hypothetical protein